MATLYIVRTNAVRGREAEFDRWYDTVHLPEVLALPGFLSAQRYRLSAQQVLPDQQHGWLAVYEIDSSDIAGTLDRLRGATHLQMSDALDLASIDAAVFEAHGAQQFSA